MNQHHNQGQLQVETNFQQQNDIKGVRRVTGGLVRSRRSGAKHWRDDVTVAMERPLGSDPGLIQL